MGQYNFSEARGVCTCGHTGDGKFSEHESGPYNMGHGPCKLCPCERFTWERMTDVYAEINGLRADGNQWG